MPFRSMKLEVISFSVFKKYTTHSNRFPSVVQKIDPDFNPVKIDQLISFKSGSMRSIFNALDLIPEKQDTSSNRLTHSVSEAVVESDTEKNQSEMVNDYSRNENTTSSGYSSDFPQRKFSSDDLSVFEHFSSDDFSLSFSIESSDFVREQFPAGYTLPTTQVCLDFPTNDVFV